MLRIACPLDVSIESDTDLLYNYQKLIKVFDPLFDFFANNLQDVTNYRVLKILYKYNVIDFILYKETCIQLYLPNFNSWDVDFKKELVKDYIYPNGYSQEEINELFTEEEQLYNWKELCKKASIARSRRWEELRSVLSFYMDKQTSLMLWKDASSFKKDYIDAGIPELQLWFISQSYTELGIDHRLTGFSTKPYYSTFIENVAKKILIAGNYDL